jgi:hypothetical protein
MYAINLLTGRLIWRTKMLASIESYALCGTGLLVNYHGLATLNLRTGHLDQTLLPSRNEFVTSDFATIENHSFIAGPKGVYAFACE